MEVVNALLRGTIELKRAELILRALNTAVRNIRRVRFDLHSDEMVREIPNYPDPPSTTSTNHTNPPPHPAVRQAREKSPASEKPAWPQYFGGADKVPAAYRSATPSDAAPTNGNAPHTSQPV